MLELQWWNETERKGCMNAFVAGGVPLHIWISAGFHLATSCAWHDVLPSSHMAPAVSDTSTNAQTPAASAMLSDTRMSLRQLSCISDRGGFAVTERIYLTYFNWSLAALLWSSCWCQAFCRMNDCDALEVWRWDLGKCWNFLVCRHLSSFSSPAVRHLVTSFQMTRETLALGSCAATGLSACHLLTDSRPDVCVQSTVIRLGTMWAAPQSVAWMVMTMTTRAKWKEFPVGKWRTSRRSLMDDVVSSWTYTFFLVFSSISTYNCL